VKAPTPAVALSGRRVANTCHRRMTGSGPVPSGSIRLSLSWQNGRLAR
jgi:hypothetical protein